MKTSVTKVQLITVFLLLSSSTVLAQEKAYPLRDDVATLSGIIVAAYDAISGEAGSARQVERIKSLYIPDGIISKNAVIDGKETREVMTIDEFQGRFPAVLTGSFYEEEINREVRIFGSIATVWSSYMVRNVKKGPVLYRGINSIQLHFKDDRWWIISWSWDRETEDEKIPTSLDAYE